MRDAVAVACLTALIGGCGVLSAEEQLLTRFFEASRLHDTTAVAALGSVTLNPRADGVVQDFEVEDVRADGDRKRVTVRAVLRRLDGGTVDRTMVFTMERRGGRWFLSGRS